MNLSLELNLILVLATLDPYAVRRLASIDVNASVNGVSASAI
jgi:hypothetical protein